MAITAKASKVQLNKMRKMLGPLVQGGFQEARVGLFNPRSATIAAQQEYGNRRLPPRSFLRSTEKRMADAWTRELAAFAKGRMTEKDIVRKVLTFYGAIAAADVQKTLNENKARGPRLKPATIKRKKKAGYPHFRTKLVASGVMMRDVGYRVVKRAR